MAVPQTNYDQVNSVTQKYFVPKLIDNIFDSDIILKKAKSNGWYESHAGGTEIVCPLNYALATASGSYSGSQTLDTTDNDAITAAVFQWKQYYASISITGRDEMINSGTERIIDFVKSKMKIAEKSLKDTLGTDCYSGSSATSLVGLDSAIVASGTYAGISATNNSWWQGQVDSSTTTLSIAAMRTQFTDATIDDEAPTLGLATRTIWNAYHALLQPQERFTDQKTADGGFTNLLFCGMPIVVTTKASAGDLYFLNEKYLHLWYHPERDFTFTGFDKPTNQDVKVAQILWFGALGSDNNRKHARFTALTA
jgi:hypothetical protein